MSSAARSFGLFLSRRNRSMTLPSVNSIGKIFKTKSLYTLPIMLIYKASLSTISTPNDVVIPASDVNKGDSTESVKSSALVGPSTSLKPMKRDERIAYLEKENMQIYIELSEVAEKINMLTAKRNSLLNNYEQLTKTEERRLKTIEEQDLPDLRNDKEMLYAQNKDIMEEIYIIRTSPHY